MNVWNKVFLGIIIVTSIAVVVLASLEMHIRGTGSVYVAKLAKDIANTDDKITKIVVGTTPAKPSVEKQRDAYSIEELRGVTTARFFERGRAWFGCQVRKVNPITLPPALTQVEAQVIITSPFVPNETGIKTDVVIPENLKGVVYVFEEVNERKIGTFLGRFRVDTVPTQTKFRDSEEIEKNGFQVTLITVDPIGEGEIDQILEADKSHWAIYMTPPVDRVAGIFDQLTEEEKSMFPEEVLKAFQPRTLPPLTEEEKEGEPGNVVAMWEQYRKTMDDPESELARDFAIALNWFYQQQSELGRIIVTTESDIATYRTAVEKAQIENEQLEADCIHEEKRVAAMNVQREHVKTLNGQYGAEFDKMTLQMEKLQAFAAACAAKITECQLKVAEKIEKQANANDKTVESQR